MAINKKLISFATQAQFAAQLSAGNIDNRSIVFIEDKKRIWTHGVYFDTSWDFVTGTPDTLDGYGITDAAKKINSLYYVEGNTTGTAGAWTGSVPEVTSLYAGLTIAYKIGVAGASTTNLNINSLGNILVRRNASNLTTQLPVGSVAILTYDGTYWVWADYDSNSNTYDRTYWGNTITAGAPIYRYKLLMQGLDGKFYPLTLENSTGATKTVSTQEFEINSQILYYNTTATVAADGTTANVYSEIPITTLSYTANQASWTSQQLVYLKGTILPNGNFKLDNTSYTSFMTQTLPTTADGFVYVLLGYMYSTTAMRLFQFHPMYEYRDGALRTYMPMHSHGNITDGGAMGSVANKPIITGVGGVLQVGSFGTLANTFAEGNHAHSQYLESITKAQVEAVLTGNITSHTHSYLPLVGGTLTGSLTATSFVKSGVTTPQNYLLQADGGHILKSDFSGSTHNHTLKLIAGISTATVDSTVDVTNPYIRLFSDNVHQGNIQIVGGANVGVVSKNGIITLTSSYTDTTYSTGTLTQLNAGTDTTGRLHTAKLLNDWLNPKLNDKFDKTGGRLTAGIGDVNIELWRGTNASWNILNSGGYLRFQSNYTTVVGDYFDALKLDYNTGNALFKGNVTAPTFIGALSGNASTATTATTATTLATARTIGISGGVTGTATSFNGSANITIPITAMDASKLTTGTVPDARLAGVYTGFTHRIDGANTIFTTPSTGTSNSSARTAFGVAEYRSSASAQVGAVVFIAPFNSTTMMKQMEIEGMLYSPSNVVKIIINNYNTGLTKQINLGSIDIPVRIGQTADSKFCVILGDVTTSWSYPHFILSRVMMSHSSVADAVCYGWSVKLETDLTGYLNVYGEIDNSPIITDITGNATTATTLQTTRAINGTNFNGSAAITTANWGTARNIGVVNSDGTGTAVTTSVNGSANINLRLPATIKAALTGNASTATKLASINTTFTGTYPVTVNVNGDIYSHTDITYTGSTGALTANSFIGNLTGNASSATKVNNNLVLKFDTGTTENTNLYTYDGSAAKTIDIKAGSNVSFTKTGSTVTINSTDTNTVYTHPSYTAYASGLYKITTNTLGHVTGATSVVKSDITALGIPSQDTTYTAGSGLTLSGTQFSLPVTVSGSGTYVQSVTQGTNGISVTLGTPPNSNTTYSAMTVAEGQAGSASSLRTMRADYLKQIIQHYNADTHWASGIRAGASGTATNAAVTNPYIKVTDDGIYQEQIRLSGSGATSVASDASGNVTISSTNTVYTHPSHTARTSGLYKITVNTLGHVTAATAVAKADITALGIPAQDTTYSVATTSANGLMSSTDKTKLNGIATNANNYSHPTGAGNNHIPTGGVAGQFLKWSASGVAVWAADNNTVYTHPTTAGNKHIPTGGSTDQILRWSSSGTAVWSNENTGSSYTHPTTDGNRHVPATGTTSNGKVLKAGATAGTFSWATLGPTDVGAAPASHTHTDMVKTTGTQTIAGAKTFTSNVTATGFFQSSDIRLKNVIEPLKINIKDILNIPSFYFTYKDKERINIGTSAQEVQKVFPEIVNTNSKGMLSVEYDKFGLIALELIKTQQKEIDSLKYELNNLKLKIDGYRN